MADVKKRSGRAGAVNRGVVRELGKLRACRRGPPERLGNAKRSNQVCAKQIGLRRP
jgi:hypothetical protein